MTTMLMVNRSMNQSPSTTSTSSTRFQPIVSNLTTFTSQLIDGLPVKQPLTMNESLKVSHNEDSQLTVDVIDLSSGNVVDHNNNNNDQDGQMDIDKCPTDSDSCDSPLAHQPTSQQSPNKLNFGMESILNRDEVGSVGSDKHSDNCSPPAMLVGSYCANNTSTTTAAASIQTSSIFADRPKRLSPSISSSSASFSSSISPTSSSNLQHTPNGVPLFRNSAAPQESASLEHLPTTLMTSGITSESNSIPNGDHSILFHPKPTRASLSIPASRPVFFNQQPSHFPALHHQAPETFYQTNNSFATTNSANDSSVFGSWPHFPFFESTKINESAFTSNNNNNKSPVSSVPISQSTLATIPFHSLFPNLDGFYDQSGYYPQPQMANGKMADSHSAAQSASSNSLLGNFQSNSTLAAAAAAYSNILPYSTLMSYLNCANLSYYNSYINNQSSSSQPTGSTKTNPALNGTNPTVSNQHHNAKSQNSRPFSESRSISHNNTTNNNNSSNLNREKKKRSWSRAVFSTLQRKGLEKRFSIQRYITKPDRRLLAATLGLTDAQVKVWFQNRRMKWRLSLEYRNEIPLIGAMHQQELNSLIQKSTMVKCPNVAAAADATNKIGRQSTMTPGSNGSTSTSNHHHNNNKPSSQKANPAAVTTTNGTSK